MYFDGCLFLSSVFCNTSSFNCKSLFRSFASFAL